MLSSMQVGAGTSGPGVGVDAGAETALVAVQLRLDTGAADLVGKARRCGVAGRGGLKQTCGAADQRIELQAHVLPDGHRTGRA